jgi:hypothetical protein
MKDTPTKGQLPWIPPEIWDMVLDCLDLGQKKRFRRVNRKWRDIATPLCLKAVIFNISQASIENLAQITSKPELAKFVQKVVLQRPRRMRRFDGFDD